MNKETLTDLLARVKNGAVSAAQAADIISNLSFEDLGFAKVDHNRHLRQGVPEVIYCQGKTIEQVASIAASIAESNTPLLATRATEEMFLAVKKLVPQARFNRPGKIITTAPDPDAEAGENERGKSSDTSKPVDTTGSSGVRGRIAVVTGGTTDIPVAEEAAETAHCFGSPVDRVYDVGVAGIHRLFANMEVIHKAKVVIVIAGMEGALAGVIGGLVDSPVVAVPTSVGYGANFGGLSALLTMLNSCAGGIGVVNIDNGYGAGYLAHMINRV